jgi:hypothetical protein
MSVYTYENSDTGIRLIRLGTREDGIYIEFYGDGTWGYSVVRGGGIIVSQDFNNPFTFEEFKENLIKEKSI